MGSLERKRWIALGAAMVSGVFTGMIYSWSVYVNPLIERYGWSNAEVSLAYTISMMACSFAPILTGRLRARMTIRQYCFMGTLLYGGGLVLCGFIQGSVLELYIYFGLMTGAGIGIHYVGTASYMVQLFPDRSGLAAGLYSAFYALGAFFWAPAARWVMSGGGQVETAFISLGLLMGAVQILAGRFFYEPEKSGPDADGPATPDAPARPETGDMPPRQVVASPAFYAVLFMYASGLVGGMMVLSLGSPIIEGTLHYSPEKASVVVGLFAVANTFGRFFWGAVSDRLGRFAVITLIGLIYCSCMITLSQTREEYLFLAALLGIPLCYGAYLATMPPVALVMFGKTFFTTNYSLLYISVALAGLAGPQFVSYIKASSGGFHLAFLYGTGFAVIATLLGLASWAAVRRRDRKNRP